MADNDEGRPATNGTTSTTNSDTSILANDTCTAAEGFSFKDDWVERDNRKPAPRPVAKIDTSDHARNYVAATLDSLAREVARTPNGARNDALNQHALRGYRLADGAGIDREIVTDTMTNAGRAAGLDDTEIAGTLRSAAAGADKYGPAEIPEGEAIAPAYTIDPANAAADDGRPAMAAHLLNATALQALPDPEPLIADTLDQGTVALLYGKWGTYKSFLALDWAASVATAHAWQGRATERRRVLYVAAEGAFGFKSRVAAWQTGWHTRIGDDDLAILPAPVNLTNNADVAALLELIRWGGYGFVILDTLARCMVGADENSAKDCGVVVDSMVRLRRATPGGRGVVLGVHHTGKDGKTFRGSSAFEAGADTVYSMTRDGGTVALDREKRKDGPETDQHELRLDLIDGTDSGVLSRFHQGGGNTDRHDRLISTYLHHFSTTGASRADLRRVTDMADSTFYRAVNDLLDRGLLVNTGTDARPFYREPGQ
jgi:AAA domain